MSKSKAGRRVVVTGFGVVTPIGTTVDEFWAGLKAGKSGVSALGGFPLDDLKILIAAQIKDFDPKQRLKHFKRDRIITLADDDTFESFRFWAVGSFERRDTDVAGQLLPFAAVGLVLAVVVARGLDQLRLGSDLARALGVSPALVLVASGVAITLLCAVATSAAGPLAFIGLLVAPVVHRAGPPGLRAQLPLAALTGATLTLASDVVGRVIAVPAEVEAGIVAAFLGAPLLLWLVLRRTAS